MSESHTEGPTITYSMVVEDGRGMSVTPVLGISIDGSGFVSVKDIIKRTLELSDLTLKSLADREAMR